MKTAEKQTLEYVTGLAEFDRLARDTTFLDFVGMYDDFGLRPDDGIVAFSTDDPGDAALAAHWIRRLSGSRVGYALDFEEGEDVIELVRFWTGRLHVDHQRLRLRRRARRFEHRWTAFGTDSPGGVVTVRSFDPVLAIRLQAWIDKTRANLARVAG